MNELDNYPKPSVTIDLVLSSVSNGALVVLLQKRNIAPFKGKWGLPGGFVKIDESLDAAAARILSYKARMKDAWVEQLYSFGNPQRDPRGRVITVAYFALMPLEDLRRACAAADDLTIASLDVPWQGEEGGPASASDEAHGPLPLAFDHDEILGMAVQRLRGKLDYSKIAFALLPKHFTLRELQDVHEAILKRPLNKPAFRRRLLDKGWLEATGEYESGKGFRPAELYRLQPSQTSSFQDRKRR